MKRFHLRRIIYLFLLVLAVFIIRYCWISFPIATGYGAKILCSSLFVSGRNEAQIRRQELGFSPLDLASYEVNYRDSSVSVSLFGLAKRTAIFRNGLGATLVAEIPEAEVRAQRFRLASKPVLNTDELPWPAGDLVDSTLPAGIDTMVLKQTLETAFAEKDTTKRVRTRAVVVVYQGKIIGEKYAEGFSKDTRLTGWSMSKSITGALIGVLVKDKRLQINALAPVDSWQASDPRRQILLTHLLQQTSGLQWEEDYSKSSDATKMLFQRAAMGKYAASRPLKQKPGSVFYYSSGNSNILSWIIRNTTGEKDYHTFPYKSLLHKIGMYNTVLEPDASGTFVGSSYCYGTARDWARFGLLYLNDGVWNGEQLLPEGWVKASITPVPVAPRGEYGYQFWLNAGTAGNTSNRLYPSLPADLYFADGYEGQNVFILPSKQLVVVRLGLSKHGDYDVAALLNGVINAIQ
jgi:CubicO group peptidase (beta-lactamase class C family)